jgi:hypothetical protein
MGIMYRNTKFHARNSYGLLVITTKLITKYKFHGNDILFSHILRPKFRYVSYVYILKVYCYTLYYNLILSGPSVASTSQLHGPVMLVLQIVSN